MEMLISSMLILTSKRAGATALVARGVYEIAAPCGYSKFTDGKTDNLATAR